MTSFLARYRGDGPLRDLTLLDFSQMMLGPLATQLIGDLGAVVIKVERPGTGEWERSFKPRGRDVAGESPYFLAMNRNKLSFAADLKDPQARAEVLALVEHCDAVVHNFRPGVMERLGFGFEDLTARNDRVVFAQGSGFGPSGPLVASPGQDLLVQAFSGLAFNSGPADAPPTPMATPVCDAATGLLLAFAIVSAIFDARATGQPRAVDVSLLATALTMQCQEAFVALNTDMRWERSPSGVAAPWLDAPYGIYQTVDGWIAVAMTPRPKLEEVFVLPAELLELDEDAWHEHREEVNEHIVRQLAGETTETWLERLADADVWASAVMSLEDALDHPQVQANRFVESIGVGGERRARAVGLATPMSGVDRADRLPPPGVGEHTEAIREELAGIGGRSRESA